MAKRITVELTPPQARAVREAIEFLVVAQDSGLRTGGITTTSVNAVKRADHAIVSALHRAGERW